MGIEGTVDSTVEILGGLVTDVTLPDLPLGVSPDCQDIQFNIGSAKTRPGITAKYTLFGNPTVNYMKTYENLQETPRFLCLDSFGNLRVDATPGGTLNLVSDKILPAAFGKSCTLFGREYIGFSNSGQGWDIPRQYDDANFDRVSQDGPGQAPSAADESASFSLLASPNGAKMLPAQTLAASPNGVSESGNVVTVYAAVPYGIKVGNKVRIAGVGVGGYNGDFTIASIDPVTPSFTYYNSTTGLANSGGGTADFFRADFLTTSNTNFSEGQPVVVAGVAVGGYNGTWNLIQIVSASVVIAVISSTGLADSGGGTITASGNVPAGIHQLSVIFVTRNRYWTKPAPPNSWTAAGGKRAVITNIPVGPPEVIARVLCFTGAGGSSFYHLGPTGTTIFASNMYIADNITTSITVDFTDEQLLLGTLDDPLFTQIVLPPSAGVVEYSNRLFWWSPQANLQSFLNLGFDGGFGGSVTKYPLGWTPDATSYAGGRIASDQVYGQAYGISGDGVTAVRGLMTQSAAQDYLGNSLLQVSTAYTVRARVAFDPAGITPLSGTLHVHLYSASAGINTTGITVLCNALNTTFGNYSGPLTTGLASIPSDLQLRVYVDGTLTFGSQIMIDDIEIFATAQPYQNSLIWASKGQLNTQGQESYDSETGKLEYNLNDGQSVRSMFKIRERLYIVKENSFGVTQDDGVNEPSSWQIDDVSKRVGTPSVNGVGIGEDWAVIAHRTGLYLFWGGAVVLISEEIRPTWEQINWQHGFLISVCVDTRKRRIFICAPFGESTFPNKTLVLDYHDVGAGPEAIASNPPIHLTYTGRKTAFDRARKWCPWTIPANCVAQIEQSSKQTLVYFGASQASGQINILDEDNAVFTDNGAIIPAYYTTSFFPDEPEEAQGLRHHRKLFDYLTMYVQGNGSLSVTIYFGTLAYGIALNPQTLFDPAIQDTEIGLNQVIERLAVKVATQDVGQYFNLQTMTLCVMPSPWSLVRGTNTPGTIPPH